MGSMLPGSSTLLGTTKFSGALDQHLEAGETVIDTVDGMVEVFQPGGNMKPHFDVAIVLTDRRLLALRGSGMLGAKKPMVIPLAGLDEVGVTRQYNVNVTWNDQYNAPHMWKLNIGGSEAVADHWMQQIHTSTQRHLNPQAPSNAGALQLGEFQDVRSRIDSFIHALGPLGNATSAGRPFGEGLDLEAAMQAVFASFTDPSDVRKAGSMVAVDILVAANAGVGPEQLDDVMGVNAIHGNHVPAEAIEAAGSLAGAAKTYLSQFDSDGANMWELWKRNDEVAAEFLCWHTVARLRLAARGLMEPL
jgi:hypothetical protein